MRVTDRFKNVLSLKNRSLKTKMALSISVLFILASVIRALLVVSYLEKESKTSLAIQQNVLAQSISDGLDDKLLTAQRALLAASAQLTPAMLVDPDQARIFLDCLSPLQTIFTYHLLLLDARGRVVAESASGPERRGLDFASRDFFQKTVKTRKPVISAPFRSSLPDQQPVVALTAPVFDSRGNLTCMLVGSLRLMEGNFLGGLPGVRIGKRGYVVLSTMDGTVISHPDPKRVMQPVARRGVNKLLDRALAGFDDSGDTVAANGTPMFTSFRHLRVTNWMVGVNLPADEAYAVTRKMRPYLVSGIVVGTLALLVVVWLLMQWLTRPLITMTRQVENMAGAEGMKPLDCAGSSHEISILTLAFNRLIETVRLQQRRLQRNEQKFRIVADNTYDWEFWLSPESRFIYSSPSCKRITGYEEAAFLADPQLLERIIHPDDQGIYQGFLSDAKKLSGFQETEYRIVRADGKIGWVAHLCQPIYSETGYYLGLRGNCRDITDRKLVEAELLESEMRYRTLVESSPAAVLLHRDGVFIYANNAACRLFGAQHPEQLIGTPVMARVPREQRELVSERIKMATSVIGQINPCQEEKLIRLDGSRIEVEVVGTHLIYQGLPTVQAIMLDISARKLAKQALKESEETLRNLIEVMPVGVALMGSDGSIEYVNRCFEESFGYRQEEIPTISAWGSRAYPDQVYREKLVSTLEETLQDARANGTALAPVEVNVTCKDGSVRHVILNRQIAGERKIAIHTDITERESLQNELLKIQKLESLGVLAGGIAHDFNNILTGILGNISFARMFLDDTHRASLPLAHAEKASLRAAELATQLLTFAKGGAPIKRLVSLQPLVEESVSLALRGANVKGVLRIPDSLRAVQADEGQLGQAFHNVIINAVQAMPDGGTLTVSAENAALGQGNREGLPTGAYVRLNFEDEGKGIPAEIQQKIFDPYFTTKPGGTGLGLASVHSIISKHGGRVEVTSTPGLGTVFSFLLPAVAAVSAASELALEPVSAASRVGVPVLVMDDEELIRTLAAQILRHLGYRVTTCSNGEEAIALYLEAREAGDPFLAAIMDLTVPGAMGGKEAARRIIAVDPSARLIVSSGYSNDPVLAQYADYGFCAAIAKPYKGYHLAQVLSELQESPGE
jgi:two-component system, cell cycle sensor histidine kinase and response regulator CckA